MKLIALAMLLLGVFLLFGCTQPAAPPADATATPIVTAAPAAAIATPEPVDVSAVTSEVDSIEGELSELDNLTSDFDVGEIDAGDLDQIK